MDTARTEEMPDGTALLFAPDSTGQGLFDPGALAVVLAGTVLASAVRCGWRDFGAALGEACRLLRRGFDEEANRQALARALSAIERDGSHRASPALPPDRALGLMLETYLRRGSLDALAAVRRSERALAEARRVTAAQVFAWAGELAPVFGLVGTLYGLTQLAPAGSAGTAETIATAISTAVLTSLYGVLIAHLVCLPLATAIERRGLAEEEARAALADWFVEHVAAPALTARERRAHLRGVT